MPDRMLWPWGGLGCLWVVLGRPGPARSPLVRPLLFLCLSLSMHLLLDPRLVETCLFSISMGTGAWSSAIKTRPRASQSLPSPLPRSVGTGHPHLCKESCSSLAAAPLECDRPAGQCLGLGRGEGNSLPLLLSIVYPTLLCSGFTCWINLS